MTTGEQGVGVPGDGDHPERYPLPPVPTPPQALPLGVPLGIVRALLDRLDALENDEARVALIRDELRHVRALAKYLTHWRSFYCSRMWLADIPTHIIAAAAGVRDTYVSRRARDLGYPPRRIDKRR